MTLFGLLAALAWSVVLGYATWHGRGAFREWLASRERIALLTATPAQKEQAKAIGLSEIAIPDDLEAVAQQESEPWAIDDVRGTIREKYQLLKDWNLVRRAVGVGEIDSPGQVHHV